MGLQKTCKYLGYPEITNLAMDFAGFLLIPSKVLAYAIIDGQYHEAKMATKSEMFAKYGHPISF